MVPLFDTMDWLEKRLSRQAYPRGDAVTEADWRLFTTLVRFDAVYHGYFKCNLRRLADHPALRDYARHLYQWPGVAETVDSGRVKSHYYGSHRSINPTDVVPSIPPSTGTRRADAGRDGYSGKKHHAVPALVIAGVARPR